MKIAPAGDGQVVDPGQFDHQRRLLRPEHAVIPLDRVEAERCETFHDPLCPGALVPLPVDRVRPDGDAARGVNHFDGAGRIGQFARHVGRAAALEQPVENRLHGGESVFPHQRAGEVGPPDAGAVGGGTGKFRFVPGHRKPERIEFEPDQFVAAATPLPHPFEKFRKFRRLRIDEEPDEVKLPVAEHRGEFHTGNRLHLRMAPPCFQKLRNSGDGVVIGERDGTESGGGGQLHQFGRGAASVGTAAVCMQIDPVHDRSFRGISRSRASRCTSRSSGGLR